jgi:hypothetical protein
MNNLEPSLLFDVTRIFANKKKAINKKLLPTVKAAINPSMKAYDTKIVKIIK